MEKKTSSLDCHFTKTIKQIIDIYAEVGDHGELETFLKEHVKANELHVSLLDPEFLILYLKHKLQIKDYLEIISVLETKNIADNPELLRIWDETQYQIYLSKQGKRTPLTAVQKYRIRQRNPPPTGQCHSVAHPSLRTSTQAAAILSIWLEENQHHPYPSRAVKHVLGRKSGLTFAQVTNWFNNARRNEKKRLEESLQRDMESKLSAASVQTSPSASELTFLSDEDQFPLKPSVNSCSIPSSLPSFVESSPEVSFVPQPVKRSSCMSKKSSSTMNNNPDVCFLSPPVKRSSCMSKESSSMNNNPDMCFVSPPVKRSSCMYTPSPSLPHNSIECFVPLSEENRSSVNCEPEFANIGDTVHPVETCIEVIFESPSVESFPPPPMIDVTIEDDSLALCGSRDTEASQSSRKYASTITTWTQNVSVINPIPMLDTPSTPVDYSFTNINDVTDIEMEVDVAEESPTFFDFLTLGAERTVYVADVDKISDCDTITADSGDARNAQFEILAAAEGKIHACSVLPGNNNSQLQSRYTVMPQTHQFTTGVERNPRKETFQALSHMSLPQSANSPATVITPTIKHSSNWKPNDHPMYTFIGKPCWTQLREKACENTSEKCKRTHKQIIDKSLNNRATKESVTMHSVFDTAYKTGRDISSNKVDKRYWSTLENSFGAGKNKDKRNATDLIHALTKRKLQWKVKEQSLDRKIKELREHVAMSQMLIQNRLTDLERTSLNKSKETPVSDMAILVDSNPVTDSIAEDHQPCPEGDTTKELHTVASLSDRNRSEDIRAEIPISSKHYEEISATAGSAVNDVVAGHRAEVDIEADTGIASSMDKIHSGVKDNMTSLGETWTDRHYGVRSPRETLIDRHAEGESPGVDVKTKSAHNSELTAVNLHGKDSFPGEHKSIKNMETNEFEASLQIAYVVHCPVDDGVGSVRVSNSNSNHVDGKQMMDCYAVQDGSVVSDFTDQECVWSTPIRLNQMNEGSLEVGQASQMVKTQQDASDVHQQRTDLEEAKINGSHHSATFDLSQERTMDKQLPRSFMPMGLDEDHSALQAGLSHDGDDIVAAQSLLSLCGNNSNRDHTDLDI